MHPVYPATCIFILVLALGSSRAEPGLTISTSIPVIVPGHSPELIVTCEVKDAGSDDIPIYLLMKRIHDDSTINVGLQVTGRTSLIAEDNRTTIDGATAENEGEKTFLKVKISNPVSEDAGHYACIFLSINKEMLNITEKTVVGVEELEAGDVYIPPPPAEMPMFGNDSCCELNRLEIEELRAMLSASGPSNVPAREPGQCSVGFSVRLEDEYGYVMRSNTVIQFTNIVTNRGDAYDVKTGVFTAPCAGLYVFSLTLTTLHSTTGTVEGIIRRGEENMAQTHTITTLAYDEIHSGSTSVVLFLKAGETVDVLLLSNAAGELKGLDSTVFSGYIISA